MKKFSVFSIVLISLLILTTPVLAVKPNGAEFIEWNLSGDVMPVPPDGLYGTIDIPGSDTASKLIVNQPNGNTEVAITGVMKGLNPSTTYTVYLSKGYTPYVVTGWSLDGNWTLDFTSTKYPGTYSHQLSVMGDTATGSSTGNTYSATITVDGSSVIIVATYNYGSGAYPYTYTAIGSISSTGKLSGTWTATDGDSGTWSSTAGTAKVTYTGSTGWPGFFTNTVPSFTFTTDEFGSGSWHINLKNENFAGPGTYKLSVWINDGATMLISDVFSVVVE